MLTRTMNYLIAHKITTAEDFQIYYEGKNSEYFLYRKNIGKLEIELLDLTEKIKFTQNYKKYASVFFDAKRSKDFNEFYRIHSEEIVLFQAAELYFKRNNLNPKDMNLSDMFDSYRTIKQEKTELIKESRKAKKEIDELNIIAQNIENAVEVNLMENDELVEKESSKNVPEK